jgi:hypothetical protein
MALIAIDLFSGATMRKGGGDPDQVNLIVSHLRPEILRPEMAQHFRHMWG